MTKNILGAILLSIFTAPLMAQYYYKDILISKQVASELNTLKDQKIRVIKINSFESNGEPSEGFWGEKKIAKDYSKIETMTKSNITGPSLFTSYFKNGLLHTTIDSSQISVSTSIYEYDDKNRLNKINSFIKSHDDDFTNEITEEHIYFYDENSHLQEMKKIKNKKDTITILFSLDDKNNIAIEKDTKTGSSYFYYYDEKSRLTDIVHSNEQKTQLLPDYMFEYNSIGQLTQMINTEEGGSNYFIWKYVYIDGLRTKEKCYSKEKRLMGTIDYEYK